MSTPDIIIVNIPHQQRTQLEIPLLQRSPSPVPYLAATVFTAIPHPSYLHNFHTNISFKDCRIRMNFDAGPSGFEPETAGSLSFLIVKSPVLYLAELRALALSYAAAHSII